MRKSAFTCKWCLPIRRQQISSHQYRSMTCSRLSRGRCKMQYVWLRNVYLHFVVDSCLSIFFGDRRIYIRIIKAKYHIALLQCHHIVRCASHVNYEEENNNNIVLKGMLALDTVELIMSLLHALFSFLF